MTAPHPEPLLTGLRIGECARWHDGRLWFANWGEGEVVATDTDGRSEVIVRIDKAAIPISIDWLADGRLLVVSGPDGVVLRREADGSLVEHADLRGLSPHTWNEIVVDGRGNLYVNTINFDFMGGGEFAPGLIALVTPDGEVRQVADDLQFPNGMVVTPDNSTLICAESFAGRLAAFDIEADGGLTNRRVWAELGEGGDGICMDAEGAVWTPAANRCERVREGGEKLEIVELAEENFCFACALGGEDGRTLFMLAAPWLGVDKMFDGPPRGEVRTFDAPAAGAGWP
jgi:sugar lactone lactonase YvrE